MKDIKPIMVLYQLVKNSSCFKARNNTSAWKVLLLNYDTHGDFQKISGCAAVEGINWRSIANTFNLHSFCNFPKPRLPAFLLTCKNLAGQGAEGRSQTPAALQTWKTHQVSVSSRPGTAPSHSEGRTDEETQGGQLGRIYLFPIGASGLPLGLPILGGEK